MNFIEGTRFSVEEAREIVTDTGGAQALHRKRPEDAHDVLETYRLIVDPGINAELEQAGQMRLVIPTSLRNDYISVLEALTFNGNAKPFLSFAHKLIDVNQRIPFGSFEQSHAHFRKTGALDETGSSQFNIRPFLI